MKFNANLLKDYMKSKKLSQEKLAEKMGEQGVAITVDGIKNWTRKKNETTPEIHNLVALGAIFEVNPIKFIDDKRLSFLDDDDSNANINFIPIYEAVAGCGAEGCLEQLTYSDDRIGIDKKIFPPTIKEDDMAVIKIVGDSMSPYLEENDWAIIQKKRGNIILADSVYLVVHGQNVQIKSCQFQADGTCKLLSINPIYPPIIAEAGEWQIVGKVVARIKVGSLFHSKNLSQDRAD
jgi:phage repressor protein C with HTH and peptisase S24 domain